MRNCTLTPCLFALILMVFAGTAYATDRALVIKNICSEDFSEQRLALANLAEAGALGDADTAIWAKTVVDSFEKRALRCGDKIAVIEASSETLSATSLDVLRNVNLSDFKKPSVNLKLRATAASAAAVLQLFTEANVDARLSAASKLDKRREAVNADIIASALERERNSRVIESLEGLYSSLLLSDPDPKKRLAAISAIAADATMRNRTTISQFLEKEADKKVLEKGQEALANIDRILALGKMLSVLYSGLSYASVLLLAALGLGIIFGLMGVINLAQGELIMIGAYAAWFTQEALRITAPNLLEYYLIAAIPVSFLAASLVGLMMEELVIRRLYNRPLMTLLATWAISILLINTVRVTVGSQNLEFYQPYYVSGGYSILGDFILTTNRLFAICVAAIAFIAVIGIIRKTLFGMNLRAVTQNRAMSDAIGINTRSTDRLAFALGSGLAGLAGLALSTLYNVNPNMGANFIVDSFMVVVLGGVGSLLGSWLAALGIGQINVAIEPLYGAVAAKVFVLILVITFIQWKPEGLFAQKGRK